MADGQQLEKYGAEELNYLHLSRTFNHLGRAKKNPTNRGVRQEPG
jgi:hypothetical protein